MRYIYIISAFIYCLYASAQEPIRIKQIESKYQVEIRYDSVRGLLSEIAIPLEFEVVFNKNDSLWISDAYNYIDDEFGYIGTDGGWKLVSLKIEIGGKYVTQYSMRYPQQSDTCYYWVGTIHNFKSNSDLQDSLSQYTKQMKEKGVTSLDVGTLSEFKKKHLKIVERVLKNDSISFTIRQQRKYVDFLPIPVKY